MPNATVMTLARYYALRDVKARLGSRRVGEMDAIGLRRLADAYLQDCPELIERAAEAVSKDPALRRIAEREGRSEA
jgi:hypothetical protein